METYNTHRGTIKSGDILVWRPSSLYGKLISFVTQSPYAHVGIVWEYHGRLFVIEAVYPCIRIVPVSNRLPFYHIKMDSELSPEAVNYAFSLINIGKYSFIEAVKSYFGKNNNPSRWQCVEFAKAVLASNGTIVPGIDTPEDLVFELQQLGKSLYYIKG